MIRFDTRIGAGVLASLGALYLVLALARGHSARAEVPPDLSANPAEAALDVWRASALLLDPAVKAIVVDIRPGDAYATYHLPRSLNAPGADADEIARLVRGHGAAIVVAANDDAGRRLVGEARGVVGEGVRLHYLGDGARAWYLAYELPVPMFSETPPPFGWSEALARVKTALASEPTARGDALEALGTLARVNYQPTLLRAAGRPKPAAGARKKIAGGCG